MLSLRGIESFVFVQLASHRIRVWARLAVQKQSCYSPETQHGRRVRRVYGWYSVGAICVQIFTFFAFKLDLDDQMSYDALANDDSMYDFDEATDDPKSTRARRAIRKKEKGDGVKRPGTYHSKVIQDMTLGQGSSSMSHVTASFADSNMMYGSNARLSQARISLTEASSALISGDSTVMNPVKKRSLRPVSSISVKEHAQIRKETPEPEYTREHYDESTLAADCSALAGDCPSLAEDYPALPENTTLPATLPSAQAQEETEPKMLFKRVEKRKPLVLLEDLNFIHRLPVSSAFTYSFYELPNQHRQQNDSIKKAADRIGRRKKKESGHFRSRSAP